MINLIHEIVHKAQVFHKEILSNSLPSSSCKTKLEKQVQILTHNPGKITSQAQFFIANMYSN